MFAEGPYPKSGNITRADNPEIFGDLDIDGSIDNINVEILETNIYKTKANVSDGVPPAQADISTIKVH